MSMLWVLGLVLLIQVATAAIVVVQEYSKASREEKQLIDKIVEDYSTFSVLQLLKNFPGVDTSKCVIAKKQYIDNLKLLFDLTKVTPPAQEKEELEINSADGNLVLPYLKPTEQGVTCQKIVDLNVAQRAMQNRIALKYQQALSLVSTDGMNKIKEALEANPNLVQVMKTVDEQLKNVMSSLNQNAQTQQLISFIKNQAEHHLDKYTSMVTGNAALKRVQDSGTELLANFWNNPSVQQVKSLVEAQLENKKQ